ncbi:xanthine dehydrogenase family protein molybdopterin-binding subunit [Myceligenerans pegani]|uniref:Xanthine dehydrogenase family protein molybdopterin-binding subunit n=1 Tax=Myceligenerans pegani TaxID=2776917 RepID=A0ABR9N5Q5_9MICO|nr:xanthine dehydrogenase family protein molybdopterin-binding subunit [Myceligenerans sp. TRM 65318]MBE1878332.1 xanthine dehydrogenase family protein molybdopterin-binding subunit [Myceligenerans sp. TRM 65318]MBE3020603.1 xanthine dehydrogenase family protein molybdopterin-binding subunit [Myceligenerans sp. TRM 65318]
MSSQYPSAVGAPRPRADGRLKVTGQARYAADHGPDDGVHDLTHAVLVDATVGRGRITAIDTRAALAVPDVLTVIHHRNAPRLTYRDNPFPDSINPPGERLRAFQDDRVRFFGQPVAVVVATTLEAAQHAARLVEVTYDAEPPALDLATAPVDEPVEYSRGDVRDALAAAPVRLDATYRMARNHHNAMEPHAIVARWDGDRLTVWEKTQWVTDPRNELAAAFGIPQGAVRCYSRFVGGAFGNGGRTWVHSVAAALAAREVGRPVKLVLTRRQLFFGVGFRPAYDYRVGMGSDRDGRVTALVHDIVGETSTYERHEDDLALARMLYDVPAVRQEVRLARLNVNTPTWMRGPGWSTAANALEMSLDELAHELGLDPLELRMRNEPADDPSTGQPFSTRRLRECYAAGAREIGWHRRRPDGTRDGDWLVGLGMAAGAYPTERAPAQAHVRLDAGGTAVVRSATSDIGPGTTTSMAQVAADALGLAPWAVEFRLGDSAMPPAPVQALAWTMASVGSAVQSACGDLRRTAVELATGDERSPLYGEDPAAVVVRRGWMHPRDDPRRGETYQQLLTRNGRTHLEVTGGYEPPEESAFSMYAYSAIFAEVGVDSRLGMVRVRRLVGVFDAGRIVNPMLAESQAFGGMTGGIGQALLERTVTDTRDGRIVNAGLVDYLVPVSADVPEIRAIYLDGSDAEANPIRVKGLGEVVQVGVAPAIANAVFNATGRRVRELPIAPEHLL